MYRCEIIEPSSAFPDVTVEVEGIVVPEVPEKSLQVPSNTMLVPRESLWRPLLQQIFQLVVLFTLLFDSCLLDIGPTLFARCGSLSVK